MVVAQEEGKANAGVTPDSILHGLDKALERIDLALTFGQANKAEKRLQIANERLAELKEMIDKGKPEFTEELTDDYEEEIRELSEIASTAQLLKDDKTNLETLIALATSQHLDILAEIYDKVPEQAQTSIESAMEVSVQGRDSVVEALKKKGELGYITEDIPEAIEDKIPEDVKARIGINNSPVFN